jgi:hypothetical protein
VRKYVCNYLYERHYLPTTICRQVRVLTQVLAQVHVQVIMRPDAAAKSLRASRDLALAALASISWLREVDFASVLPKLPILRVEARNADRSTSGE